MAGCAVEVFLTRAESAREEVFARRGDDESVEERYRRVLPFWQAVFAQAFPPSADPGTFCLVLVGRVGGW